MSKARTLTLILLLMLPMAASAETFRLSLLGGYAFGGELYDPSTRQSTNISEGVTYGFALDIPLRPGSYLEILWRRHESGIDTGFNIDSQLFDMNIDLYQIGGIYEFESGVTRPYLLGTLGVTSFSPEPSNISTETKFSMVLGGGVTIMPTEHLGVRFEGKGIATFVGSSGGGFWCGAGGCWAWASSEVLWQAEATGGLVFSF